MADITRGNILWAGNTFQCALNGTVSAGDPIGQDGTGWVRADADGVVSCQGFALKDGVSGDVIQGTSRCIQQTTTTLTIGAMVFLSNTAGRIADANPGAAATALQVLGFVVQATPTGLMYLDSAIQHTIVRANLAGTAPATGANYGYIFTADRPYRFVGGWEVHRTAGNDVSAVTLDIEKCPSGTSQDSGTVVSATTPWSLKSTAAIPVWLGPSATAASARLAVGDSLVLKDTGTLTAVADLSVTLTLIALER